MILCSPTVDSMKEGLFLTKDTAGTPIESRWFGLVISPGPVPSGLVFSRLTWNMMWKRAQLFLVRPVFHNSIYEYVEESNQLRESRVLLLPRKYRNDSYKFREETPLGRSREPYRRSLEKKSLHRSHPIQWYLPMISPRIHIHSDLSTNSIVVSLGFSSPSNQSSLIRSFRFNLSFYSCFDLFFAFLAGFGYWELDWYWYLNFLVLATR